MLRDDVGHDLVAQLKPQQVRAYALAKGWKRAPNKRPEVAVFNSPNQGDEQLIIPVEESLTDYTKRLREVVDVLAAFESRPAVEVLGDLLTPEADVLRFRTRSASAARGILPLADGIRLLEGAKKSILAAACSVVHPVAHHPRMSHTEAQQLVSACQLGQTERGSYTVVVSCPLRAVEQEQTLLAQSEPFTRQAVSLLIRSLDRVANAIEQDDTASLITRTSHQPTISANLCDALLLMQPPEDDSELSVSVSWAATLPATVQTPSVVRIKHEYFRFIEDVYKKLQPSSSPEPSLFVGYVDTLNGQPNEHGKMQGETTVSVMYEEEMRKARVDLSPSDYQVAIQAHSVVGAVKFKGVLHLGRRVHRITDIIEFARVQ
jgi:hypothetical protein